MKRALWLFVLLALSACASAQQKPDAEQMLISASALTKLTAAVQVYVRYENPPPNLSEEEIISLASRHDPTLRAPFSGYKLRVKVEARQTSVLMCSADGTRGLLEDVGCTGRLDRHVWQSPVVEPCEFSVDITQTCDAN